VNGLNENPDEAAGVINARLTADAGKSLADDVIARALESVTFTTDPIASAFTTLVKHAVAAGTGKDGSLDGLFDLSALNKRLSGAGLDPVSSAGLGKE
jgi:NitT/TauT family transport system substrate-binding protein